MNSDRQRREAERQLSKLISLKRELVRLLKNFEIDQQVCATLTASVDSRTEELKRELELYTGFNSTEQIMVDLQVLRSASKLPASLISGRRSLAWSQKDLAQRATLTPAQICHYRKTFMASCHCLQCLIWLLC